MALDGYVGTEKLQHGKTYRFTVVTVGYSEPTAREVVGTLKGFELVPPAQAWVLLTDGTRLWRGDIIHVEEE